MKKTSKTLWVMGPRFKSPTGISIYSEVYIKELSRLGFEIDELNIPFKPRTIFRYLYQFIFLPLLIFKRKKLYSHVVLYEEGFSFLVLFCRLFNIKSILIYHHFPEPKRNQTFIEMVKDVWVKSNQSLLKLCDYIIVPSENTKKSLCNISELDCSKISIIYNAFQRKKLPPKSKHDLLVEYGIEYSTNKIYLLFVGSDETRKNFEVCLRALNNIGDPRLVLIKIGKSIVKENKTKYLRFVKDNCLKVYFLEDIPQDDLSLFYKFSDIFLMPSSHEGFGRSVIEAQLMGLPVLASEINVFKEILRDSCVFVCNYFDFYEWSIAIITLLNDKNKMNDLIKKGFENSSRFLIQNNVDKFIKLINL